MRNTHLTRRVRGVRRVAALTLVEMLVIIGVCGVMALLLVPMLMHSRANARAVVCSNNLKALGQAYSACLMDSGGFLPDAYYTYQGQDGAYQVALKPAESGQPDTLFKGGTSDALVCPADASPTRVPAGRLSGAVTIVPASYAYNVALPTLYRSTSRVDQPVNTVTFYDGDVTGVVGNWSYSATWAANTIKYRHHGEANFLYLDGHVQKLGEFPAVAFAGGDRWIASSRGAAGGDVGNSGSGTGTDISGGGGWTTETTLPPATTTTSSTLPPTTTITLPIPTTTTTSTTLAPITTTTSTTLAPVTTTTSTTQAPTTTSTTQAHTTTTTTRPTTTTTLPPPPIAAITVTVTAPATVTVGDTIVYHFRAENPGQLVLHGGGHVYSALLNTSGDHEIWTTVMDPGAVYEFDKTYKTSTKDIGQLVNSVTALGHPMKPNGTYINDVADAASCAVTVLAKTTTTTSTTSTTVTTTTTTTTTMTRPAEVSAAGIININPSNSQNVYEFTLTLPDGTQITRDDLASGTPHSGDGFAAQRLEYTGPASVVYVKPKGNANQNGMTVDGAPYPLQNGVRYTISSSSMNVHLYNDKYNGTGKAMGKWWIAINATNATIQVQ